MFAVTLRAPGGPEVLEWSHLPDPEASEGEVVIRVAAAGVNRADLLQRAGHYPPPRDAPTWPGLEVSGVVEATGPGVVGWTVGDEVCALLGGGGYAELAAAPAGVVLPVPAGVDLVAAAALPEAAATAWSNLVDVGRLAAGESVLIHGGSGGVGSLAIQIAAALGAQVFTTARGPQRAARCRDLGAQVAIDYTDDDVGSRVAEATSGRGVDLVLDVLGAGALAANLDLLATDGRLVVIGLQQGRQSELDLGVLLSRRLTLAGTTLRGRPLDQRAAILAAVREQVWPLVAAGRVRPVVHEVLALREAARAHELLDSGAVFGKLLLVP